MDISLFETSLFYFLLEQKKQQTLTNKDYMNLYFKVRNLDLKLEKQIFDFRDIILRDDYL